MKTIEETADCYECEISRSDSLVICKNGKATVEVDFKGGVYLVNGYTAWEGEGGPCHDEKSASEQMERLLKKYGFKARQLRLC